MPLSGRMLHVRAACQIFYKGCQIFYHPPSGPGKREKAEGLEEKAKGCSRWQVWVRWAEMKNKGAVCLRLAVHIVAKFKKN